MKPDKQENGKLWNELSDEQKDELLASYEESEDEANLIEVEKVFVLKSAKQ